MVRRMPLAGLHRLVLLLALPAVLTASACSGDDDTPPATQQDASIEDAAVLQDTSSEGAADASPESGEHDGPADDGTADGHSEAADAPGDAAPASQRIASLNLHCLKTADSAYATNEERFAAIAQTIADEGIVAVAVQEACIAGTTDALEQLREAISKSTGEIWSKQWMLAHIGWQGTPDEAQEGVGILARGTLSDVTQVEFRHQSALKRVMIGATLPASSGGLRLWSLHLELNEPDVQVQQAREAAAVALAEADPSWDVVVGGDFNAVSATPVVGALGSMGFEELTASLGTNLIDHIFVHRGAAVSLEQTRKLFDGTTQPKVSDHPGVMVELSPAAGQQVTRTRFVANATTGQGSWLALRGSSPPLDWGWGWPGWMRGDGKRVVVTSELQSGASVEYKWLIDDTGWQTGGNASCAAGSDCELTPAF